MEKIIDVHIEKLPEGLYLATSSSVPGLIAQGKTIAETLEIARDVARKLLELQAIEVHALKNTADVFDYPLIVSI